MTQTAITHIAIASAVAIFVVIEHLSIFDGTPIHFHMKDSTAVLMLIVLWQSWNRKAGRVTIVDTLVHYLLLAAAVNLFVMFLGIPQAIMGANFDLIPRDDSFAGLPTPETLVCLVLLSLMARPRASEELQHHGRSVTVLVIAVLGGLHHFITHIDALHLDPGTGVPPMMAAVILLILHQIEPIDRIFNTTRLRSPEMMAAVSVYLVFNWLAYIGKHDVGSLKYFSLLTFGFYLFILREFMAVTVAREQLVEQMTRQNAELARRRLQIETVTRSLTHDLRSPVRNLHNLLNYWTEFTEDGSYTIDELRDLANQNLARAERLSERFTEFLKVESDAYEAVHVYLDDLLGPLAARYETRALMLIVNEVPEPVIIAVEAAERVLENLIENAINHNKDIGVSLLIHVTTVGNFVDFAVEDDGQGIPEAYRKRIFEPFETLENKAQTGSSGLGLAICGEIISSIGGSIASVEPTQGTGARFVMRVPMLERPV